MPLPAGYRLSFEPAQMQLDVIHGYLCRSYWSPGIPRHAVAKAVANSLVVGAFGPGGEQVGFARMVTDHVSFGYLADVFVLEEHRGRRLGHAMVQALLGLPEVRHFRTLLLLTRDAHSIYADCGFQRVEDPAPFMQLRRPGTYPPPGPEDQPSGA